MSNDDDDFFWSIVFIKSKFFHRIFFTSEVCQKGSSKRNEQSHFHYCYFIFIIEIIETQNLLFFIDECI